jgi:penicillin G amidase
VETVDPASPDRYLEGSASEPFQVIEETLRIKDKKAPQGFREEKIAIRMTKRGPVVSDVFPDLKTDRVVTLRWAPAESMLSTIGLSSILTAQSTGEVHEALKQLPMLCLNWVFADKNGHIGHRASGRIPVRGPGQGTLPHVVKDGEDNWKGWIPQSLMPHANDPEKGWLGTCNHKTVPHDYPYYYSSYFSPSYRYRRLKELMADPGKRTVDDHWQYQRDVKNLMAQAVAPIMAKGLQAHEDTREMGDILARWNFMDQPDLAAPTIFQATYINFARRVFEDELGPETVLTLLNNWYFWEERLERMVLEGSSHWFDDQRTSDRVETAGDLFHTAGQMTRSQLTPELGKDPEDWLWGRIHTLELVSPLRRKGLGKGLLGSGPMAAGGSGETLNRGWYDMEAPFGVTHSASLRMVADLSQDEKVAAVLPGGVTGRQFTPHQKDQVGAFMNGDKLYWWFSDAAIDDHTCSTLYLKSEKR